MSREGMMYKVTLIEGKNDISFGFSNIHVATELIDAALQHHLLRETDSGVVELVVEIETMEDDF